MFNTKKPHYKDNKDIDEAVLLKDLVSTDKWGRSCDYLALSVKCRDEHTCIQITTTDSTPVTFIAVLPKGDNFDYNSLLLVVQPGAFPAI